MLIFPAIDMYEGRAVRLLRGDYDRMEVFSDDPASVARSFREAGAGHIHLVDLEGARDGGTPNLETAVMIKKESGLFCEIGGGIRDMDTVKRYLGAGMDRVILGTSAIEDPGFLKEAVDYCGEKLAVSADIRDGFVAVRGWKKQSGTGIDEFMRDMTSAGIRYMIITDISKDGAMQGTNRELYKKLSETYSISITASGGVSSMDDVRELKKLGLYGAIIGKAVYTGAIDLSQAVKEGEC